MSDAARVYALHARVTALRTAAARAERGSAEAVRINLRLDVFERALRQAWHALDDEAAERLRGREGDGANAGAEQMRPTCTALWPKHVVAREGGE